MRKFVLKGQGLTPTSRTKSGFPSADGQALRALCERPSEGKYGTAFKHFENKGESGKEACEAIESLLESGKINTLLSSFIIPLQELADKNGRLHTSINLNTETGRLSSRKPNLQNQPALEKDRYKIRKAFTAEKGKKLIVADYGQLELRILAHITNCQSMLEAFKKGGDFHSRTAMGMYDYIKKAVDDGSVLLEWDPKTAPLDENGQPAKPPAPLLKDKFAAERRKAKTLNFSIAYGKTAFGLSKDWGVSLTEAKQTLKKWYADRKEVEEWQEKTKENAKRDGYVSTLMGRRRNLPDAQSGDKKREGHALRAAINTPIQGGAADIVMKAMLDLRENEDLKSLGWKQILQIHDELILEGLEENAEKAFQIVVETMKNPIKLRLELTVDAHIANNWFEGK